MGGGTAVLKEYIFALAFFVYTLLSSNTISETSEEKNCPKDMILCDVALKDTPQRFLGFAIKKSKEREGKSA
jgi:hypothetical protein